MTTEYISISTLFMGERVLQLEKPIKMYLTAWIGNNYCVTFCAYEPTFGILSKSLVDFEESIDQLVRQIFLHWDIFMYKSRDGIFYKPEYPQLYGAIELSKEQLQDIHNKKQERDCLSELGEKWASIGESINGGLDKL